MSCATRTFCVAVDTGGHAAIYNGKRWAKPTNAARGLTLESVSCRSSSFCAAVDYSGHVVLYDGKRWTKPRRIDRHVNGLGGVTSVSCPAPTFCAVIDRSGRVVTYNGKRWSSPTKIAPGVNQTYPGRGLTSVSCASKSFCVATDGDTGAVVTYKGTPRSRPSLDAATDTVGLDMRELSQAL